MYFYWTSRSWVDWELLPSFRLRLYLNALINENMLGWTERSITKTCDDVSQRKRQRGKSYLILNKKIQSWLVIFCHYACASYISWRLPGSGGDGLSWPPLSNFWRPEADVGIHFLRVGGVYQEQRFLTLCHDHHIISSSPQLVGRGEPIIFRVLHSWAGLNIKRSQEMIYESHSQNETWHFWFA